MKLFNVIFYGIVAALIGWGLVALMGWESPNNRILPSEQAFVSETGVNLNFGYIACADIGIYGNWSGGLGVDKQAVISSALRNICPENVVKYKP